MAGIFLSLLCQVKHFYLLAEPYFKAALWYAFLAGVVFAVLWCLRDIAIIVCDLVSGLFEVVFKCPLRQPRMRLCSDCKIYLDDEWRLPVCESCYFHRKARR